MLKMKQIAAIAALGAAAAVPAANAEVTGNVGAFSEYMFRGIAQTGGAAIQGGLDYAHESGFYAGTWASNIGFAGGDGEGAESSGTEQDFYVGFGGAITEVVGYDFGVTYYWYPEEDEATTDYSTFELYGSLAAGPVTFSAAYSSELNFFIGDGNAEEGLYLNLAYSAPIKEGLTFDVAIGQYSGDEIERVLGTEDSYVDYSIGLTKEFDAGFTATMQYIATDIDAGGFDDDPKFVIGLTKGFDI